MNAHRKPSQKSRVLGLLREAGARGIRTNEFLTARLPRFSARLLELRNEGYVIEKKPDPHSASGMIYTLDPTRATAPAPRESRQRKPTVEDRLVGLVKHHGERVVLICRSAPASPYTRWTVQLAPEGRYPNAGEIWIGTSLDEALTSAENAQRAKQ